jgi:DNA-binding transcriptional MerR regulator
MLKIGEVAKQFNISNRTLRYWEEAGILESSRTENGYRFYDDENASRIRQIVLLRKLKMPVAAIERIFMEADFGAAYDALVRHMEKLKREAAAHNSLIKVIERLVLKITGNQSIEQVFSCIETQSEIIKVYGYEIWVTIPDDFEVVKPMVKKQVEGTLYASIPAHLNEIGERWQNLAEWVDNSGKYAMDPHFQWLEECVDFETFYSSFENENIQQLDLLAPVKLR